MLRLYAPVLNWWWNAMAGWIQSRSCADCHKFINEHDDELVREVREVLKYEKNLLFFLAIAAYSQQYTDSLVFLALRMIHRHPLSLSAQSFHGLTPLQLAEHSQFNACREIRNFCRLPPRTSPPPPTSLSSDNSSPKKLSTRRSSVRTTPLARSSST